VGNQISVSKSTLIKGYAHTHFYPLEVASMAHLAEVMLNKVWSPCIWREGYRLKNNFEAAHYIALDFDDGRLTLDQARARAIASGKAFILGTSKSHQKEKKTDGGQVLPACDRFRLVYAAEADTPITKEIYEYNMAQVMELYPCDPSCKDAGRFFYGCKEIVDVREGEKFEWAPVPEHLLTGTNRTRKQHERWAVYRERKLLPPWVQSALAFGSPEGGRHQLCYKLGCVMIHFGYSEEEIVGLIMKSPLAKIGKEDVERAVANGSEKSSREYDDLLRERATEIAQRLGETQTHTAEKT
jgi:hypothetical protein